MASLIVSGTPAAVPEYAPKLERMSARTTPLWLSTSGPFEPSPGNGPAVSSGMTAQSAAAALAAAEAAAVADADADDDAAEDDAPADGAQPASTTSPAPSPVNPMSLSIRRRSSSVSTSNARPWS